MLYLYDEKRRVGSFLLVKWSVKCKLNCKLGLQGDLDGLKINACASVLHSGAGSF